MSFILKKLSKFGDAAGRKVDKFSIRLKTSDPISRKQLYAAIKYPKKNYKEYERLVLTEAKERKNAVKAERHLAKLMKGTESVAGGYKKTRKNKKRTKHNIRSRKHRK
jgi:hypothetical protein